jgi:hypothetical protein
MHAKCPFAAPLTKGQVGCRYAQEVVRRGGSEYDCRSEPHQAACADLFDRLKAQALPAFGVEDDLAVMPHSVLVKIQAGGLLGLGRLLGGLAGRIEDVSDLVGRAQAHYGSLGQVPYPEIEADMTAYRLERRGRRG